MRYVFYGSEVGIRINVSLIDSLIFRILLHVSLRKSLKVTERKDSKLDKKIFSYLEYVSLSSMQGMLKKVIYEVDCIEIG